METKKIFVGQIIWYYHIDRRTNKKELIETVVSKAGNKYFEVNGIHYKFHIDNLRQVSDYSPNIEIVLNKDDFEIEMRSKELSSKIRKAIGIYDNVTNTISLDKLEKIANILEL